MPSLDTLDISHNKIKRMPSQPGQLIQLRVSFVIPCLPHPPHILSGFFSVTKQNYAASIVPVTVLQSRGSTSGPQPYRMAAKLRVRFYEQPRLYSSYEGLDSKSSEMVGTGCFSRTPN